MDDIGLHLAQRRSALASSFGRGMVKSMPHLLKGLAFIGTAAMLWVGGGIIVHGLEHFGWNSLPHIIHELAARVEPISSFGPVAAWLPLQLARLWLGLCWRRDRCYRALLAKAQALKKLRIDFFDVIAAEFLHASFASSSINLSK